MIVKMNNKDEKFYQYMGKVFGSRIIQNQTNDRIYDDDNKTWYLNIEEEIVLAFISVANNTIKNVYTIKDKNIEELLKAVKEENKINFSTVTNRYVDAYKKTGYKVQQTDNLKNFIVISA